MPLGENSVFPCWKGWGRTVLRVGLQSRSCRVGPQLWDGCHMPSRGPAVWELPCVADSGPRVTSVGIHSACDCGDMASQVPSLAGCLPGPLPSGQPCFVVKLCGF